MKKILLIYAPFCTPASPPYSLTSIYSFLQANFKDEAQVKVLDLNLEFHKLRFPDFQKYYQQIDLWKDYDLKTKEYDLLTKEVYSKNNNLVVEGKNPELIDQMLDQIKKEKPDFVAFSVVYSSQAFYVYALLKELNKLKENNTEFKYLQTVIGGPSINNKLKSVANKTLSSELELLKLIRGMEVPDNKLDFKYSLDYSIYKLNDYFTPHSIIPIKTSSTCFYQQCTFCAHYAPGKYYEYDLSIIKKSIVESKQKYFFFIDDMIPMNRLLEIAKMLKPLNVYWTCQLRPTKDHTYDNLKELYASGLRLVLWGLESGNDRVLGLIKKGTNSQDIAQVLKNSRNAGIGNVTYVLLGFPGETKEEFISTIDFLTANKKNIDLLSVSVFGLQNGTPVYNNPEKYGITKISQEERTVLEPKISYELSSGLTNKEAQKLKYNYKKTLDKINKYPKSMNFFRGHMLCLIVKKES